MDHVPTDGIADIVSLKTAWLACRGAVHREVNSPLNTSEKAQISEAWVKTHVFNILGDMLLNQNMTGPTWRALHATHRKLSTHLMETSRVQSSTAPRTKAFANASKPGEPTTAEDCVADETGTIMEAHSRARAFFMTFAAFVMILDRSFFQVTRCIVIENKVFSLVQMTVDQLSSASQVLCSTLGINAKEHGLHCP